MKTPLSPDSILRPQPSVSVRRVGQEMVLLNLESGVYFGLNDVGADMWAFIEGGASLAAIVDGIMANYDVPRARCQRDVEELAARLLESGLVVADSE